MVESVGGNEVPISGLSILLSHDETLAGEAMRAMRDDARLELGPRAGARIAVVGEASDREANEMLWQWLHDQPGIVHVDVVFIHFDEGDEEDDHVDGVMDRALGTR